jgi:hypothetical protein
MSVLFAFLHHVAAFTLVAAIALEFVLLRDELTLWSVRRLQVAGMILGIAAGVLLIVGLARVVWFEKGAAYYFANHAFLTKCSRSCRPSNSCPGATHQERSGAGGRGRKAQARTDDRACRTRRDRADRALRRHHGQGWLGLTSPLAAILSL